ncbi:hypothetical protein ACN38_g11651, partial [Penicillium nordicum]
LQLIVAPSPGLTFRNFDPSRSDFRYPSQFLNRSLCPIGVNTSLIPCLARTTG